MLSTLLDATHNTFRVSANGLPPVTVAITLPGDLTGGDPLATLCAAIQTKVRAQANGKAALSGFLASRAATPF